MRAGSVPSLALILLFAVLIAACHGKTILLVADIATAFDIGTAKASWVVSAVAVIAAVASPLVNWIVVRAGERRSIVAGLVVASASSYLGSLASSFQQLIELRIVEGAGYITVVLAALGLLVHTSEGARRTSALAFWSIASPLGGAIAIFCVAPYVGGQWRVVFSAHALVLALLILLTPLLPSRRLAAPGERKTFRQVWAIYRHPKVLRLALAVGAPLTVALGLITVVPAYFISELGVAPAAIGVISTVGILSSVLAGLFAGVILNLRRAGPLAVVAAAVIGVVLEIVTFLPGAGVQLAVTAKITQGFFSSFVTAWVFTSIPKMSPDGDVIGAGSIAEQFLYISMFLGPVVMFPLYTLPSHLLFFVVLSVAGVLPLFLLPLDFVWKKTQRELVVG